MDLSYSEFQSLSHGVLRLEDVIKEIKYFLEENPDAQYSLVIGSDSQEKTESLKNGSLTVVTAVVVHRKGFGGKYFWQKKILPKTKTLREKIYTETLTSLSFATFFVPMLKKSLNGKSPNYNLEIHVDVGEHGETRNMIKEVVGMVVGNGFVAKIKPLAFGASYVADKHT
ncbi:MAG: ribonuclease H-like YkuK family protein [Candidatus Levyibacteriota bacterium]|nr:MAG: ribonuclease H-like YkuK family protein [Candidatus Levybacteria bacterium]